MRTLSLALILLVPAACSGPGRTVLPSSLPPADAISFVRANVTTGTMDFTFTIPAPAASHPRYVSPSTKSTVIAVYNKTHVTLLATVKANLLKGSHGCVAGATALKCTVAVAAPAGNDTFDVVLYDATGGTGKVLSALKYVPYTVIAGKTATLALAYGGYAASIAAIPVTSAGLTGSLPGGFTIVGSAPQKMQFVPKDADGNLILGPGAPQAVVINHPADVVVGTPVAASPTTWTLTSSYVSSNPTTAATSSVVVEATPVPRSGGATAKVTVPLKLYQPWIYVMNYGASSYAQAVTAYDANGKQKTLTGSWTLLKKAGYALYVASTSTLFVGESAAPGAIYAFDLMGNGKTLAGNFSNAYFPAQMALDPQNNEIYVPNNEGPNYVTAYDLQGNQQSLPAGAFGDMMNGPLAVVYDPANGSLYGTNVDSMAKYDDAGTALSTGGFSNLGNPDGVALDPNNGYFYVSNYLPKYGQDAVTVYDDKGTQHTLAGSFSGLSEAGGVACDPYDGKIFVSNFATPNGSIAAFDEQGRTITLAQSAFPGVNSPNGILVVP